MNEAEGPPRRTIALVGLMGVGKSSVGRRLAKALDLPFKDADEEIERAAGRSVAEIFAELERLCDRMLAMDLDRSDVVIALGGGVVGDLAGFAAAIYKRGIDFIRPRFWPRWSPRSAARPRSTRRAART